MEQETNRPVTGVPPWRDRKGNRVYTHNYNAFKRGCRCEVCREANNARNRAREQRVRDGLYHDSDDGTLELWERRGQETTRLHEARLREAYAALVARVPAGFRPCGWETFLLLQGDLSTVVQKSRLVG